MRRLFQILAVLFCLSAMTAAAHEVVEDHPIDVQLEEDIDADSSTYGMMEAYKKAIEAWDRELNKNYQALMKKLDRENQATLRASQREWMRYRDLEFAFNRNLWVDFEGTMYRVFPLAFQAEFVKERALRLRYYLEDLTMEF